MFKVNYIKLQILESRKSKTKCNTWNGENIEKIVSHQKFHFFPLLRSLPLLVCDLVPPESVLVVAGEAVHHDRNGQRQDEHAAEGTKTTWLRRSIFLSNCLDSDFINQFSLGG